MKFGRLISFFLVLALSFTFLTSCSGKTEKRLAKADEHLSSNPYQIKISVDFDTAEEDIAGIFSELEKTVTTVWIDGDNFRSHNVTTIETSDAAYEFNTTYIAIGETAYREIFNESDGIPLLPIKSYTFLNAPERQSLLYNVCRVGGVTIGGFANLSETKLDKKVLSITCTEASDEVKESLRKMMVSFFEGSLERAVVNSVILTVNVKNNRYQTATVYCNYDVTIDGKVYSVSATVNMELSFGEEYRVYTPTDATRYSILDPEDFLPL